MARTKSVSNQNATPYYVDNNPIFCVSIDLTLSAPLEVSFSLQGLQSWFPPPQWKEPAFQWNYSPQSLWCSVRPLPSSYYKYWFLPSGFMPVTSALRSWRARTISKSTKHHSEWLNRFFFRRSWHVSALALVYLIGATCPSAMVKKMFASKKSETWAISERIFDSSIWTNLILSRNGWRER